MRQAAPSIFASGKHASRSERYSYIPTIEVLRGLRTEGFEPFMVAQSKSRIEGKTEFTKHMIRMRHAHHVGSKAEANEIILINSHDGASCYQLLCGVVRYVCCNGLVVGDIAHDIRLPHRGDIQDEVIEGAIRVLGDFEAVDASIDGMKLLDLKPEEEHAFATAARASLWRAHRRAGRGADHCRATDRSTPPGRPRTQPVGFDESPAGKHAEGRPVGSKRPGATDADARGWQHQPQPGAVGAGRGDVEAEGLIEQAPVGEPAHPGNRSMGTEVLLIEGFGRFVPRRRETGRRL
jgi:hypothetical protein